ncbi:732_t:CDS:1 [Funneliformis mosseae]|uniref:732_t:CDS:1 n=1 Tax=Funneliformis mosseae TaxID=27381 RepID=A0A9N9CKU5_FUNMO|nr:732_t:CDS:1 [Funneliformis mosseae]
MNTQVLLELDSEYLKVSVNDNCSYCNKSFVEKYWCKKCDPWCIIEGWTSGNSDIDKFIKDTMYEARHKEYQGFLEWVPFDQFTDIKEISEGGFAKVFSATWIDGKTIFKKHNGGWKKLDPKPMKVALKRINGMQDMSAEVYFTFTFISFY